MKVYRYLSLLIALSLALSGVFAVPPTAVQAADPVISPQGNTINSCGALFFSEYIEGSGVNKAIEIYNGTGATVNLSDYKVELYSNGAATPSQSATLSGTLANGDVYVIANTGSNAAILAVADLLNNSIANFNGDDALALRAVSGNTLIDAFGQIGFDPGAQWGTSPNDTVDNTLVRKAAITTGDNDGSNAFDPVTEWDSYATDTFTYIGSHTATCGVVVDDAPTVSSTLPTTGATGVAPDANLRVTFSEKVALAAGWYSISCTNSGAHTAAVDETADPIIVLNPAPNFTLGELCTVSLEADFIVDEDGTVDNMAADHSWSFTVTATDPAPIVSAVTPANSATGVPLNRDIIVTFSEPVTVADGWYSINCVSSGAHTAVVTPDVTNTIFTLNPGTDFGNFESCTVTLESTLVNDQDTSDPDDYMAADYTWNFGTSDCSSGYTPISSVQGSGSTSPLVGTPVTVRGVVTADLQAANLYQGLYFQSLPADVDGSALTSEGLFAFTGTGYLTVNAGDLVQISGTAIEYTTGSAGQRTLFTQIDAVTSVTVCLVNQPAPAPAVLDLPDTANPSFALEPYEGMLVTIPETLTVQQNYFQGRFGQLTLGAGGRIANMNNVTKGGGSLYDYTRMIILDDSSRYQNLDPISFYAADGALRAGDTVENLTGIVDQGRINSSTASGDTAFPQIYYRLQPTVAPTFTQLNPRTATLPAVGGRLKIVGTNVLNYFPTLDMAPYRSTFPYDGSDSNSPRGADSAAEFTRQQDKLVAALAAENGDVYTLMEIESWDGAAGGIGAPQALCNALNTYLDTPGLYVPIADPLMGYFDPATESDSDNIQTAIIYKTTTVAPVGAALSSDDTIFDRSPFAQEFEELATGAQFVVVANHFKSKGSCPAAGDPNADQRDGQGCWNLKRQQQATALLTLINSTLVDLDPDVFVMGDLNSYGAEDPITVLTTGGLVNQIAAFVPAAERYSYVFDGTAGYLDHALSTPSATAQITDVSFWHINADEPVVIDYNTEFKPVDPYQTHQYKSSDHDPVIIGLNLIPPPTTWADDAWIGMPDGTAVTPAFPAASGTHIIGYDAFDTIQEAVNAVAVGGTTYVLAGNYTEQVTITKALTLQGETLPTSATPALVQGKVTIAAAATVMQLKVSPGVVNGDYGAFYVSASDVTVSDNLVDGMTGATGTIKGVHIYKGTAPAITNITITRNTFQNLSNANGGADGIMVQGVVEGVEVTQNTISNITASGWAYGIEVTPTASAPANPPLNVNIEQNSIDTVNFGDEYMTGSRPYPGMGVTVGYATVESTPYPGDAREVVVYNNSFVDVPVPVLSSDAIPGHILNASGNFSDPDPLAVRALVVGTPYEPLLNFMDYTPWLEYGTDTDLAAPGFQGDFSFLNVDTSTQSGTLDRIQEGINLAESGGTVSVWDGTYYEPVMIQKSLLLKSENGAATTIIHGGLTAESDLYNVSIRASDVTVDGFTVTNPMFNSPFGGDPIGIAIGYYGLDNDLANIRVTNNIVTQIGDPNRDIPKLGWEENSYPPVGICVNGVVAGLEIDHNIVFDMGGIFTAADFGGPTGIALYGYDVTPLSTNVTIHDNKVYDITITNTNDANGVARGIRTGWGSGAATITGNTVYDIAGIGIQSSYITNEPIVVEGNTVYNNTTSGISLEHPDGGSIIANNIYNNGNGIYLGIDVASATIISYNRLFNNTVGLFNAAVPTANAENNWWGCNEGANDTAGDCDTVAAGGPVYAAPWLVLSAVANPASILPLGTSTITADMLKNSAGTTPAGFLPDGILAAYSAPDGGTLTAASAATLDGALLPTTTFTAPAVDKPYQVCTEVDNELLCVDVTVQNVAPVAVDDTATTAEDTPIDIDATDLMDNDGDANADKLSITEVSNPTNGTVSLLAGVVTFTPTANFFGTAGFDYTVSDGLLTDTGHVTVTVTPTLDDPVAVDDEYTTNRETELVVSASAGVLANDEDVDFDSMVVTMVAYPMHGELTMFADGSFVYTPEPGFVGYDTFTYRLVTYPNANAVQSWTDEAVVTIHVTENRKFIFLPIILR